jgi:hypothetical protein
MFATQGSFSRKTGEALKYYFKDDHGQIVLRDHGGTDAETGTELQKVTPDIMKLYRLQQQGILNVTDETLFDPKTGQPLKRYYREQDETITLFPLDVRFHPQYGSELEIITPDVAVQFSEQMKNSPRSGITGEAPKPVSLVPEEDGDVHEMTSPQAIERLNQEYKNKVQGQLDATHTEKENESKEEFDEALDDVKEHQDKTQE